ncbi:hypothetical protein [Thalassolituus sp.]|uniref:hypothetical protein n=1 Tax=Thalassolituus sp. TaxID=2030822 RepID=UPI002A8403BE|nr:hypothetical protein [Thalassolituus sp.]|tara:strand:- start:181 stop:495 length:315 start_codon:yes stop_codon:yes gene_type:complete
MKTSQKALIGLSISGLVTLAPFLLMVLAYAMADIAGCELAAIGVSPCQVAGVEVGRLLYSVSIMGWLFLVVLPIGTLLIPLCFLWWLIANRKERIPEPRGRSHF